MSDLQAQLASANSTETTDDSTQDSSGSDEPDFAPNETTDGYALFGNAKSIDAAINDAIGIDRPDVNTYRLEREDIASLRKQAEQEGWHPNAAKWAIDAAMKSWLGDRQREMNEGFGVGLEKNDDGTITGWQDGQYMAYFGATLPTLEHEAVDEGEVATLEEHGVTVETLGHNPDEVPVLPVLGGERVPLFVDSFDALDAYIEQVEEFPSEPSLGNVEESDDGVQFAVLEGTLDDLESELASASYTVEDLEAMLEAEREGKDRKGGVSRIEAAIEEASEASANDGESAEPSSSDDSGATAEDKIQAFNRLCDSGVPAEEAAERVGL